MALNIIGVTTMVKAARYYEDSKGTPWKTEFEAWRSDVALWLITSEALNEASANKLVEYITNGGCDRAKELAGMLLSFAGVLPSPQTSVMPQTVEAGPPSIIQHWTP